ncbi:MAG: hypothetical protein L0287_13200, partial [Anaerolineae bacterium]|nr:hypothetical protein [Anaerolineae bacterium]
MPVPDEVTLMPSLIGTEPFQLSFQALRPRPSPGATYSEGMDDHRGTFIKSNCIARFPVLAIPPGEETNAYIQKALTLTNKALQAIRYTTFDHTIRYVDDFENYILHIWQVTPDGSISPAGAWLQGQWYGPFGVSMQATLTDDGLNKVGVIFNELALINPAWLLVLDAKYHNTIGDIERAILDIGTALDIHIERLINIYSRVDHSLAQVHTDGKTIFQMHDEILIQVTGHSLHERPELFAQLEYIRAIRNSITHRWKSEFRISPEMARSKYLHLHQPRDGT